MNKLNAEGHDESQYLPTKWYNPKTEKEEPYQVVNAFRAAKGDVIINETGYYESLTAFFPNQLSKILDEKGQNLLSRDDVHTCKRIERAVLSAWAVLKFGHLKNFTIGDDIDTSKLPKHDPFVALLTGLLPYQSNICLWVIFDDRNRGNIPLATKLISSIRNSIDLAKNILDNLPECRPEDNV